jgi:hypothetical protein
VVRCRSAASVSAPSDTAYKGTGKKDELWKLSKPHQLSIEDPIECSVWTSLDWIGLGWIGLDWIGLGWVGLVGFGWVGLGWVGLGWVGLDWI